MLKNKRTYRIFLASSMSMTTEREIVEHVLRNNVNTELYRFENDLIGHSIGTHENTQNEIIDKQIRESDLFILLYRPGELGHISKHELDVALERRKRNTLMYITRIEYQTGAFDNHKEKELEGILDKYKDVYPYVCNSIEGLKSGVLEIVEKLHSIYFNQYNSKDLVYNNILSDSQQSRKQKENFPHLIMPIDKKLEDAINNPEIRQNMIIVGGESTSGKTMAVVHALQNMKENMRLLWYSGELSETTMESYIADIKNDIERIISEGESATDTCIVFDDIQDIFWKRTPIGNELDISQVISPDSFLQILRGLSRLLSSGRHICIATTYRNEEEMAFAMQLNLRSFPTHNIHVNRLTEKELTDYFNQARSMGVECYEHNYASWHTIGSLFISLDSQKEKYHNLTMGQPRNTKKQKQIAHAIKCIYLLRLRRRGNTRVLMDFLKHYDAELWGHVSIDDFLDELSKFADFIDGEFDENNYSIDDIVVGEVFQFLGDEKKAVNDVLGYIYEIEYDGNAPGQYYQSIVKLIKRLTLWFSELKAKELKKIIFCNDHSSLNGEALLASRKSDYALFKGTNWQENYVALYLEFIKNDREKMKQAIGNGYVKCVVRHWLSQIFPKKEKSNSIDVFRRAKRNELVSLLAENTNDITNSQQKEMIVNELMDEAVAKQDLFLAIQLSKVVEFHKATSALKKINIEVTEDSIDDKSNRQEGLLFHQQNRLKMLHAYVRNIFEWHSFRDRKNIGNVFEELQNLNLSIQGKLDEIDNKMNVWFEFCGFIEWRAIALAFDDEMRKNELWDFIMSHEANNEQLLSGKRTALKGLISVMRLPDMYRYWKKLGELQNRDILDTILRNTRSYEIAYSLISQYTDEPNNEEISHLLLCCTHRNDENHLLNYLREKGVLKQGESLSSLGGDNGEYRQSVLLHRLKDYDSIVEELNKTKKSIALSYKIRSHKVLGVLFNFASFEQSERLLLGDYTSFQDDEMPFTKEERDSLRQNHNIWATIFKMAKSDDKEKAYDCFCKLMDTYPALFVNTDPDIICEALENRNLCANSWDRRNYEEKYKSVCKKYNNKIAISEIKCKLYEDKAFGGLSYQEFAEKQFFIKLRKGNQYDIIGMIEGMLKQIKQRRAYARRHKQEFIYRLPLLKKEGWAFEKQGFELLAKNWIANGYFNNSILCYLLELLAQDASSQNKEMAEAAKRDLRKLILEDALQNGFFIEQSVFDSFSNREAFPEEVYNYIEHFNLGDYLEKNAYILKWDNNRIKRFINKMENDIDLKLTVPWPDHLRIIVANARKRTYK